jgi:integrase
MRVTDLKPSDIRDWVGQQTMSLKSLQNKLLPLRAVLAEAVADEVIPVSPLDRVPLARLVPIAKRASDYDPQPYNLDELTAVLAATPVPARWAFQLWAFTGLRTGELIGLRWPRVDLIGKTIRISETTTSRRDKPRAKTKAGLRVIPLLPAALQAVEALRAYTQLAGDRVTVNPRSTREDKAWDDLTLAKVWQAAHKSAGVTYRQPYNLRHTYASQLLSQGENALHIAKIMGHRTTDMISKHYGKWMAEGSRLGFDRPARRYGMEPLIYAPQKSAA